MRARELWQARSRPPKPFLGLLLSASGSRGVRARGSYGKTPPPTAPPVRSAPSNHHPFDLNIDDLQNNYQRQSNHRNLTPKSTTAAKAVAEADKLFPAAKTKNDQPEFNARLYRENEERVIQEKIDRLRGWPTIIRRSANNNKDGALMPRLPHHHRQ